MVSKAKGVFLWVFLVVRSLIAGLTNADRITDLRRRLRLLPADLESYFTHMLATIDTFYEQQTAQTFQIALHTAEPQNIMTYVMLDELDEDLQFALDLDIREWQRNEIRSKAESMELRINARGMGLLEVVRSKDSDGLGGEEVDFLHRAVRDFFRLKAPEDWIARRLPPSFNPDQLLYNAILAQVKTMSVKSQRGPEQMLRLVDVLMRYAYTLEKDSETAPTILLDNLAHTISQLIKTSNMLPRWEQNKPYYDRIRQLRASFLSLAVQKDLKLYVAEKLDKRSESNRSEDVRLICRALWPHFSKEPSGNRVMLSLLLKKGVHMNKADNSWHILFWELANGWAKAPDDEKILQLETINTLLLARENPREAFDYTCWTSLLSTLPQNWLSGSIELQRTLKTTMSLLLETVSGSDPVDGKSILWRKIMSEIEDAIMSPGVGPASMEIILEMIKISLRHGASLDTYHGNVILALWRDPYVSTEQKAELRAMLPSDHIDSLDLPYRLHPVPGQTLDNPGRSLNRSALGSEFDSETDFKLHPVPGQTLDNLGRSLKRSAPGSDSDSETDFKRPFKYETYFVFSPPDTADAWDDYYERLPTPPPSSPSNS